MKTGIKFDTLAKAVNEDTSYQLNANGIQMIKKYHSIINSLEQALLPVLETIVRDLSNIAKEAAVQIVSSINSSQQGSEEFDLMSRLDTLTNGGKTPIQGSTFTFNEQDKILQYLEKV
jgi:hypothetical protein